MIGSRYWSTGIVVTFREAYAAHLPAWSGSLRFFDDGFLNDRLPDQISTEGTLHTRYAVEAEHHEVALTAVVDTLIRDAERLGIGWQWGHIYYPSDGESTEFPPPDGWREMLAAQCRRIGWADVYAVSAVFEATR